MLPKVKISKKSLRSYRNLVDKNLYLEIRKIARKLKGLRIVHLNATPQGGGVAEILQSLVPLMRDIGLKADWYVIPPDEDFFKITKEIHNTLQGKELPFDNKSKKIYLDYNKKLAQLTKDIKADIWVIHDPQPLPILHFNPKLGKTIWRCHIDTSTPNQNVWKFILPFVEAYDQLIFTLPEFTHSDLHNRHLNFFTPTIDPLTPKNIPIAKLTAQSLMEELGINPEKPIITQISRFDPWKDPKGVINAYYWAKMAIPELQLVLMGFMTAKDDPEAEKVFKQVKKHARGDPDIYLLANPDEVDVSNDMLVNALHIASDVIIQKSIREGFGLVVTEAMWKGKPVIGGDVGGIRLQIENGVNGFLVKDSQRCAQRIIKLVRDKKLARQMGRKAKQTVKKKFLITRLLRDYLRLFERILQ